MAMRRPGLTSKGANRAYAGDFYRINILFTHHISLIVMMALLYGNKREVTGNYLRVFNLFLAHLDE